MTAPSSPPNTTRPEVDSDRVARTAPKVLVAIASYGRRQDHYLAQVIEALRRLEMPCRIVVLTEAPKPVEGAEVLVGLPSRNSYSLQFAHRKLFADNVDNYDLFIYTEDDTPITAAHLEAFLDVQRHLREDEIAGFIRSEVAPDGRRFVTSVNHFFRWDPRSIENRNGVVFAQLTNEHSGCFVATRKQLKRALDSGGFLVAPHDEMYGMLESAASDIYRQCGLRRVLCISRISDFIVEHLANKYFLEMGLPFADFHLHIETMIELAREQGGGDSLFEPASRVLGFRWSKNLYDPPCEVMRKSISADARTILSIGVGSGRLEERLASAGAAVDVIAVDTIFAGVLRRKRLNAGNGSFEGALSSLGSKRYDAIVLEDVLQLLEDPVKWLRQLGTQLSDRGQLIARIPNTGDVLTWARDLRNGRLRALQPSYPRDRVQRISPMTLKRWLTAAGLRSLELTPLMSPGRREKLGGIPVSMHRFVADAWLLKAGRK